MAFGTGVFICPADAFSDSRMFLVGGKSVPLSYGLNDYLSFAVAYGSHQLNHIPAHPDSPPNVDLRATMPVIADATCPTIVGWDAQWRSRVANANQPLTYFGGATYQPQLKRHPGGSLVLFADDHVGLVSQQEAMGYDALHYSHWWW